MFRVGEGSQEAIRPDFNKSIFIDFAGAKITSDAGFLLMREVDKGGSPDRLSRMALVRPCGYSFSFVRPLQGCPWMATQRKNARERSCNRKMGELFSDSGRK
jgi:hypothetical protein